MPQIQRFTDLKRQMEEIREKVMGFLPMREDGGPTQVGGGGDGET